MAYANPNILDLIEAMGAPIIASAVPAADVRHPQGTGAGEIQRPDREHLRNRGRSADHSEHRTNCFKPKLRKSGAIMIEFPVVLVINCGSSSVVLGAGRRRLRCPDDGHCRTASTQKKPLFPWNGGEPADWLTRLRRGAGRHRPSWRNANLMGSVALIGHRIAHGGDLFSESTPDHGRGDGADPPVSPLAPLHNYANLSGVEAAERLFPVRRWRYLIPASTRPAAAGVSVRFAVPLF